MYQDISIIIFVALGAEGGGGPEKSCIRKGIRIADPQLAAPSCLSKAHDSVYIDTVKCRTVNCENIPTVSNIL